MKFLHKELAKGRWFELSLVEQLANVGTDIERAISWKKRGKLEDSQAAFFRAHDLLSLTIIDSKHKGRRKELCRTREALVDYFMYDNEYSSSDEIWQKYFNFFSLAAASRRRK